MFTSASRIRLLLGARSNWLSRDACSDSRLVTLGATGGGGGGGGV